MTIREQMKKREQEILEDPFACLSINSEARDYDDGLWRSAISGPVFQRDRDRILHSKGIQASEKNKTQVLLTPKGDHYRTRMSHTLEVSQNAGTLAKALRLNEGSGGGYSAGTRP